MKSAYTYAQLRTMDYNTWPKGGWIIESIQTGSGSGGSGGVASANTHTLARESEDKTHACDGCDGGARSGVKQIFAVLIIVRASYLSLKITRTATGNRARSESRQCRYVRTHERTVFFFFVTLYSFGFVPARPSGFVREAFAGPAEGVVIRNTFGASEVRGIRCVAGDRERGVTALHSVSR